MRSEQIIGLALFGVVCIMCAIYLIERRRVSLKRREH